MKYNKTLQAEFIDFVIQMEGIDEVLPNVETHPEFGVAMADAKKAGVDIIFIKCKIFEDMVECL